MSDVTTLSPASPYPLRRVAGWFCILAVLMFGSVMIGRAGLPQLDSRAEVWAASGAVALADAAIATVLLHWLVIGPHRRVLGALRAELAERQDWQRRLRHDLRGALSPALLTADRLLTNEDPKVKRAGDVMVQAVERAAALIADRTD